MSIKKIHRYLYLIRTWIFIQLSFFTMMCHAQPFPQDYFIPPMDTPVYLSAPFGSLRENHFHSGMDIRTYEKEGLPVYAIADGYVSRIKVSSTGYGKAVYIDHPNGYTSVYAHLLKYEGDLGHYIKSYQYEKETFGFDHFPERNKLKVSKGQIIGWSGNSGSSTGPHLHFEIRETKTEEPLNPQLFNIPTVDLYAPVLKRFAVYSLNSNQDKLIINRSINTQNVLTTDSGFILTNTLNVNKGLLGFGIEAVDYLTNTSKEYSIYCSDLYYDNRKQFSFRLDRINFNDTKNINAHIDYEIYKQDGYRIQKCFLSDGNKIQIYPYMRNKGKIFIDDTLTHSIKICLGDFSGQYYTFYANIKATDLVVQHETPCTNTIFYPNKDNYINENNCVVHIPAKALYDTINLCYSVSPNKNKALLSNVFQIHHVYTPLQKSISVSIKADTTKKDKLLLAVINKDGTIRSAGGHYKNGWVTAQTSQFGNYAIAADSVAPEIKILNVTKTGECKDSLKLAIKITDNFSGIESYKATINGKWVLADFDAKNDLLVYEFDNQTIFNEKINVVITVTDKKQNTAILQKEITLLK